jgi:hypothetical protein
MIMRKVYRLIAVACTLFVLVFLIGLLTLPFFYNEPDILIQPTQQSVRVQRIAKNVLILEQTTPSAEHASAISELQNGLPALESTQKQLQQVKNSDSLFIVNQSMPDFVSIDTAARSILAHASTEKVDPTQAQIVLNHERNYSLLMTQLSTLRQSHVTSSTTLLSYIEIILAVLAICGSVALYMLNYELKEKQHVDTTES